MNIEQLLPWLKTQKVYACQRCLNHSMTVPRKNHKWKCPFLDCHCYNCQLVERRRLLNQRLHRVASSEPSTASDKTSTMTDVAERQSESPHKTSSNGIKGERKPHCQRCAQHGVQNRLKGHKQFCPFNTCTCAKCQVVLERQRLMADQIKLRRKQKKEKIGLLGKNALDAKSPLFVPPSTSPSTASSSNESFVGLLDQPPPHNNVSPMPLSFPFPLAMAPQLPPTLLPSTQPFLTPSLFPPPTSCNPLLTTPPPLDWRLALTLLALQQQFKSTEPCYLPEGRLESPQSNLASH